MYSVHYIIEFGGEGDLIMTSYLLAPTVNIWFDGHIGKSSKNT